VEALSHGRPVDATPAGASGIEAGVVMAADARAFAAAVRRLLDDEAEWARRAADATTTAAARFSPDAVFAALDARLAAAVRR
jgi:hypothetical protein